MTIDGKTIYLTFNNVCKPINRMELSEQLQSLMNNITQAISVVFVRDLDTKYKLEWKIHITEIEVK